MSSNETPIDELIDRSSLGTKAARQLRSRTTPAELTDMRKLRSQLHSSGAGSETPSMIVLRTARARTFGPLMVAVAMAEPPDPPDPAGMRRAELIDRAHAGDVGAFGELYDEYSLTVYRHIYERVSSSVLAEDLTSETFVRALHELDAFRWQDRDFGEWLVTIARRLIHKSGRARLGVVTDEIKTPEQQTEVPEVDVLAAATAELLRDAISTLPDEQRDCLTMRFFAGLSIAETAVALEKTEDAVKQLQTTAARNLAKIVPK